MKEIVKNMSVTIGADTETFKPQLNVSFAIDVELVQDLRCVHEDTIVRSLLAAEIIDKIIAKNPSKK